MKVSRRRPESFDEDYFAIKRRRRELSPLATITPKIESRKHYRSYDDSDDESNINSPPMLIKRIRLDGEHHDYPPSPPIETNSVEESMEHSINDLLKNLYLERLQRRQDHNSSHQTHSVDMVDLNEVDSAARLLAERQYQDKLNRHRQQYSIRTDQHHSQQHA